MRRRHRTVVGVAIGFDFTAVLRPLFVEAPHDTVPVADTVVLVVLVLLATLISSLAGSRLVNRLQPTELLRDE